jgi:putative nucleotidyltransferase with HDIG domain
MNDALRKNIMNVLIPEKKKEYACHVQYVAKIGLALAEEFSADKEVVEIACLLHDIGRDKELPGEEHAETSRRLAEAILKGSSLSPEQISLIYACILSHGSEEVPPTIEQRIVRSADAGSKVEYHEAFMLMCKKLTYQERLEWGVKYLEKGFSKICVDTYKERSKAKYEELGSMYRSTLEVIEHVN